MGDRLFGQAPRDPEVELFAVSQTEFIIIKAFDARVEFVKNANGRVTALVLRKLEAEIYCSRSALNAGEGARAPSLWHHCYSASFWVKPPTTGYSLATRRVALR